MPKRKSEEFLQKIQRKMRKLNRKLKDHSRRLRSSSSESEDSNSDSSSAFNNSSDSSNQEREAEVQAAVGLDAPPLQTGQDTVIPVEILGNNPLAVTAVGPEVHTEIASRWTTFCRTGVEKADRKSLIDKYPRPSNVEGLSPPKLNSEIGACLTENMLRQDNFLFAIRQIAAAMSAIAVPMNVFFSNPSDETNVHLQDLANVTKLLSDVIHSLSKHRRYGLSNTININITKVVMDRPIEGLLFGEGTSSSGSRPPIKPPSGNRPSSDFLGKRHNYNHRKKGEGSRKDQKPKKSWKRSDYRK